ncbi:site-specific integrase [uncultured Methylobacterium sp.]|uniref:tyrosine-type recombinase/integrase n=1 Tax=uncultured Methylobacterium sp. TaxID=157278 RepID=UPI002599CE6E|nr:site-specific integrase [uncultured Methylobacterium sp.]
MSRRADPENVTKLTKASLAALTVPQDRAERIFWDKDVPGFGIRVRQTGGRTWVIRPPRNGNSSKLHTLGPADKIELSEARRVAREKLAEAALGSDPTAEKRKARERAARTVGSFVPVYLADREKRLRPKTLEGAKNHLNKHWAPIHDRPLSEVTRAEVATRHRQIATEFGPHAADRARLVLSAFFSWAMREGLAEANPVANTNTATTPTKRERVLRDDELAIIWKACRDDDFGRIVKLLILTGQRRNEVAGMSWDEIDLVGALWTIPADRMKNRRPHLVPLSRGALQVLESAPRRAGRDLVFGDGDGAFSGFSRAKASLEKRSGCKVPDWNLHDLRRTAATGMATNGTLPHVVEAVLSHISGSKAGVAGVYNRADYMSERREALDRWAEHVQSL